MEELLFSGGGGFNDGSQQPSQLLFGGGGGFGNAFLPPSSSTTLLSSNPLLSTSTTTLLSSNPLLSTSTTTLLPSNPLLSTSSSSSLAANAVSFVVDNRSPQEIEQLKAYFDERRKNQAKFIVHWDGDLLAHVEHFPQNDLPPKSLLFDVNLSETTGRGTTRPASSLPPPSSSSSSALDEEAAHAKRAKKKKRLEDDAMIGVSLSSLPMSLSEEMEYKARRMHWQVIVKQATAKAKDAQKIWSTQREFAKKVASHCQRRVKKRAVANYKISRDFTLRAKRISREMINFLRKHERETNETAKRERREAQEKKRMEELARERLRQLRKINFLLRQSELVSDFMRQKMGAVAQLLEESGGNKNKKKKEEGGEGGESGGNNSDEKMKEEDGASTGESKEVKLASEMPMDSALSAEEQRQVQLEAEEAMKKVIEKHAKAIETFDAQTRKTTANSNANNTNNADNNNATTNSNGGPTLGDQKNLAQAFDNTSLANPSSLPSNVATPPPPLFQGSLKAYQLVGFNWLVSLYEQGVNGLLADEMGLGKTVQAISLLTHLAYSKGIWGPFLVIAPLSTLHNWHQELNKFCPSFRVIPYFGAAEKDRAVLRRVIKNADGTPEAPCHVVVTNYNIAVQDAAHLMRRQWQYMVLDEAQAIKSADTARWKTLLNFSCRNRLLLTGTPIQNTMAELWALLHFIMPDLFDSFEEFNNWFSKDVENHAENKTQLNQDWLKRLHMILKPFMLRRVKSDVETEMSEKIEIEIKCDMSIRQVAFYSLLRRRLVQQQEEQKIMMQQPQQQRNNNNNNNNNNNGSSSFDVDMMMDDMLAEAANEDANVTTSQQSLSQQQQQQQQQQQARSGSRGGGGGGGGGVVRKAGTGTPSNGSSSSAAPTAGGDRPSIGVSSSSGGQGLESASTLMNIVMQFRKVCNHPDLFHRADFRTPLHFHPSLEYGLAASGSSVPPAANSILQGEIQSVSAVVANPISFQLPRLFSVDSDLAQPFRSDKRRFALDLFGIFAPHNVRSRVGVFQSLIADCADAADKVWKSEMEDVSPSSFVESVSRLCGFSPAEMQFIARASPLQRFVALHAITHAMRVKSEGWVLDEAHLQRKEWEEEDEEERELRLMMSTTTATSAADTEPLLGPTAASHSLASSLFSAAMRAATVAHSSEWSRALVAEDAAALQMRFLPVAPKLRMFHRRTQATPIECICSSRRHVHSQSAAFFPWWDRLVLNNTSNNLIPAFYPFQRPSSSYFNPIADGDDDMAHGFYSSSFRHVSPVLLSESPTAVPASIQGLAWLPTQVMTHAVQMFSMSHVAVPEKNRLIADSGKMVVLDKLLAKLYAEDHKVLIFCQMTKMLDLLEDFLWFRKYRFLRLDGQSSVSDRKLMVDRFQTQSSDVFVFMLSTRAGGLGINLTAADTVIFFDSDWNPTMDAQAMDRCHRHGQSKQVTVYRLICKNTIEEKILRRAREKATVQKVVISGEDMSGDFAGFKPSEVLDLLLIDENEVNNPNLIPASMMGVGGGGGGGGGFGGGGGGGGGRGLSVLKAELKEQAEREAEMMALR